MTVGDVRTASIDACPACQGTAATQVGRPATGFDTAINGRLFRQPPYVVRHCDACGLYFKSATLSAVELSAYYAMLDSAPFEYDGQFPTDRLLLERLAALPERSEVLDFGCSSGRILKSQVARLRCVGVEPNEPAAAVARSRGIAITSETELWRSPQTFDAILLTDVYEHLTDPVPLAERLAGRLAVGGWLAIITGNADAITDRDRLAEFWYFRLPGHVLMVSERHLHWLAARLQLTLAEVHRCSHYATTVREELRQRVQAFAYGRFRTSPHGLAARVMRLIPRLKSAEQWTSAPAFTCGEDHVVAFFQRS